ncbi:MAG TPA: diguanylate cyclase [Candidatus Sulfotelmatobacter sp.]|nr:diguanylate cyclase [Candidatus Sulfotelmatobacter sp.]
MFSFDDSELCRNILESLPTGLCVVDLPKRIMLWSNGAERITGFLRHEVIGRCCIAEPLLHCDQPGCEFCNEECPLALAMKTAQPAEAAGFVHHKAGYEVPVRMRSVPIHNQHGSIVGAVEIFDDLQHAFHSESRENAVQLPVLADPITETASRVMMELQLRRALDALQTLQVPFGVLSVRVEKLMHFRASLGAEAAASLLRVIARTLEGTLSMTDFIGRWKDDQFMVVLSGCREEALPGVGERVRRTLSAEGIEWWGERRSLPVSIGAVYAHAEDTLESLLERMQESLQSASSWITGTAVADTAVSGGS